MGRVPMDIVELCILPKLPIKSLLRFKCVSKSWQTLISSNDFSQLHNCHLDLSSGGNRVHIFPGDAYTLHLHHLDSPLTPISFCPYPYPYPYPSVWAKRLSTEFMDEMSILASCEYFLLVSRSHYKTCGLILFNPFTRIYREIPDNIIEPRHRISYGYPKYGLYLDEAHDDLKVVRVVGCSDCNHDGGWEITIFSLKTDLWTLIETKLMMYPFYYLDSHPRCVSKNLIYTIFRYTNDLKNVRIGCFDIQAEKWTNDVPLPRNLYLSDLCLFDGFLCALGVDKNDKDNFSAWVLEDCCSWVRLMTIVSNHKKDRRCRPIAYRKGSRHEILCRWMCNAELFWYNLRDKDITNVDFKGEGSPDDGNRCNEYGLDHICKESLMSFPDGGQPQRWK